MDVQCTWDPKSDTKIPTNYTLHWEPAKSGDGNVKGGTSLNGHIPRENVYALEELRVWVQAKNQHGSAKSQEVIFNIENISKPPTPQIKSEDNDLLEIWWSNPCTVIEKSPSCDIRYRTEEDQHWPQYEDKLGISYTVDDPEPGTVYEFQVRCACAEGPVSNWSKIYRIKSTESAPVGEVDVWRDCGIFPAISACFLTWRNLSVSQARGFILGYELTISYSNGTVALINVSTAEPSSQYVHSEMKLFLTSPLKNVTSVSISAYNALGATEPSSVVIPTTGKEENAQQIDLKMNEENLTVTWDPPSQFSDDLREYVVQYKQAGCPPGQGFDWIRVNKTQKTAFFQGQFKKYTAYQVSLFTVSNSNEVRKLSSVVGYSLQKAPSTVHLFTVSAIGATDATLSWELGPLSEQTARILYYQIGLDTQYVYKVSASPHHQKMTFKLPDLSQGREYEVRIRAMSEAGPGANVTRRFTTKYQENLELLVSVVVGSVLLVILVITIALLGVCQGPNKMCPSMPACIYEKVPDPRNSHIFRQMKHQFNEPLGWICIPVCEPQPTISVLEVVEMKSLAFDPDELIRPVVGDECSQVDCKDDQREDAVTEKSERADRKYGREPYSKMVDSDEERGDCWSLSEEEQFTSDYEKHFMPSPLEVL